MCHDLDEQALLAQVFDEFEDLDDDPLAALSEEELAAVIAQVQDAYDESVRN
jgi:hypothetical protein